MKKRYEIGVVDDAKGDRVCLIWPPDAVVLKKYFKTILAASSMIPLITGNQIDAIALPESKVCCLSRVSGCFLCMCITSDEATATSLVREVGELVRLAVARCGGDGEKLGWVINQAGVISPMLRARQLGAILRRVKMKTPVKIAGVSKLHVLCMKESFTTSDACINLWATIPEPCVERIEGYPREGTSIICVREADRLLMAELIFDAEIDIVASLVAIMDDAKIWSLESYLDTPELPDEVSVEEQRLPSMIEIALHGCEVDGIVDDEDRVSSEGWRWGKDISMDDIVHG